MKETYKVKVNKLQDFSIAAEEINDLDIISIQTNEFHLLNDNKSVHASIVTSDFLSKTYTVKVNATDYQVKIDTPLDSLIEEMGLSVGAQLQINELKAPMPGLVFELNVNKGDEVEEGQALLILEAMKMENVLTSPRSGVIKKLAVEKGQTVAKNDLLIEFE